MKRGIIFDMDGTLWDSAENVAKSWTIALSRCGYEGRVVTKEDMYATMGRTMDVIADILFPFAQGEEKAKLLAAACELENDYLRENGGQLYPGLEEVLQELSGVKGRYHLYIVSNCQAGYIEAFLDYFGFWHYFEDIECFGNNGLPKAENIRLLYERNKLDVAAYVGDIQADYDAATAAGLPFIHAAYGFGEINVPVPRIDELSQLPEVAKEVLYAHN